MKKITTLLLALLLCCCLFTACEPVTDSVISTPDSSIVAPDSSVETPDSSIVAPDSSIAEPDSSVETPDSSVEEPDVDTLEDALAVINSLYKSDFRDNPKTASTYKVVSQVMVGVTKFPVTWAVDVTEGVSVSETADNFMYTITVERGAADINYVLTATVTDGTDSLSTSYELVVPAYAVNTYAEYAASSNGDNLTVRGIVIGIESKDLNDSANSLFLQDLNNEGGYYLYGLSELPEGIAVGMTVEASGVFELYNGTYELKDVSAKIIDSNVTEVAPVDYTEAFVNAADTKAEALVSRQAMLVTVKGVTITDQNTAQGYLNFELAGKTSYLRISSSHNCITPAELDVLKALHTASFGSVADVTGYVAIYNGAFYLVPVGTDAIANVRVPERSDAEKVELEKSALKVTESVSSDTTITLPTAGTSYENVAIAWESNSEYAVVNGGEVAITVPDTKVTVTLTATLTLGDVTDTATFEIVLNKMPTAIAELNALGLAQGHNTYTAEKYIAEGIITEVANETYGNLYIQDNNGEKLYVYGLYWNGARYDKMATKPAVGDYVRVIAPVGQYNGTAQMKNADVMTHAVATSLPALTELGIAQGHNTYTAEKYLAVATVKEVYNTTYGNITLVDADNNTFTVYGSYDVFGVRYDKLAVKPAAGDTIGVYGIVGQYNGTAQIKNGVIVYWAQGTVAPETCPGCGVEGDAHEKCAVCGEYLCKGDHSNCGATEEPAASEITLTVDNLGLGAYAAGSATVDGVTFAFTELGSFGNGIQMRINKDDSSKKSSLANSTAFAYGIKEIRLTYNSAKSTYDNTAAFTFTFGNDATVASYSVDMDTVKGEKSYVVTPDAATYTYFKMSLNLSYSFYWDSIVIVLDANGTVEPDPDPVETCPGCGADEIHTETCEYCGELLCKDVHANCGATEEPTTISIADALAAADGTEIVVTGIVKSIDTVYNSQYDNISVTITDGTNDLYLYRLAGNVEVDSIITVTGKMATYNDARQVGAGATFVLEGTHEHAYTNGVCAGCGKNEPKADTATISFASTDQRTVLTTTQQVWEQNGITVTNNKASSTSDIADYAAPARFYANTELIIEYAAGISKIEFTTAGGKNFKSFTYEGATVTVNGTSCIMEFATPVTSISFTLSAQVRVSQIVING